jgi:hypothetical protein
MNLQLLWKDDALDRLARGPCGYRAESTAAAEPTALAAMALAGAGRVEQARPHLAWLAKNQTAVGLSPPSSNLEQPGWPTAMSILASTFAARCGGEGFSSLFNLEQASRWLLGAAGKPLERSPEYGHDGRLIGWPWVVGTHSWQEPTAWSVLALKATGLRNHPRTREGVTLLVDRLLDIGGCNYGNTFVLGQRLRPHIEPTGITLVALADESIDDPRIQRSCKYLESALTAETPPISLGYGLLGLIAHRPITDTMSERLAAAYRNMNQVDPSPVALALLSLAAQQNNCPLIKFTSR